MEGCDISSIACSASENNKYVYCLDICLLVSSERRVRTRHLNINLNVVVLYTWKIFTHLFVYLYRRLNLSLSRNCNRVQFYQGFYQASRPGFEIKVTQIFITKRECKTVRENKVRINEMKIFFQRKRFWLKLSQESSIKLCIFLQHSVWIVDLKIEEFVFKKIESQLWKIIILKRNLYY